MTVEHPERPEQRLQFETDTTKSVDSAIVVLNLSYGYGETLALSGVSAQFPRAAVTAIIGGNGAGKSTLLGVLAGTLNPASGRVKSLVKGRPAFVLQRSLANSNLPFTVQETVAMGRWGELGAYRRMRAADREIIHEAMELLDITDLAKRQLSELSGGQRQRALLAQGIAQQSELLLLDEPIAGLDVEAEQRIAAVIRQLAAEGKTVIQATHSMAAAREADHCVMLAHGHLVAEGDPAQVLAKEHLEEVF